MTQDLTTNEPETDGGGTHNMAAHGRQVSSTPVGENIAASEPTAASKPRKLARHKASSTRAQDSKTELVLKKLRLARGVTIDQIKETTDWQAHSVRGFMSAVVRKKLGLNLVSEIGKDGQRRYRISGRSGEMD